MEVKGKEIRGARSRGWVLELVCVIGLEITISLGIRDWAFQSWKGRVFRIHDSFDIGWCLFEQSGIAIPESWTGWWGWQSSWRDIIYYCSSRFFDLRGKTRGSRTLF